MRFLTTNIKERILVAIEILRLPEGSYKIEVNKYPSENPIVMGKEYPECECWKTKEEDISEHKRR